MASSSPAASCRWPLSRVRACVADGLSSKSRDKAFAAAATADAIEAPALTVAIRTNGVEHRQAAAYVQRLVLGALGLELSRGACTPCMRIHACASSRGCGAHAQVLGVLGLELSEERDTMRRYIVTHHDVARGLYFHPVPLEKLVERAPLACASTCIISRERHRVWHVLQVGLRPQREPLRAVRDAATSPFPSSLGLTLPTVP